MHDYYKLKFQRGILPLVAVLFTFFLTSKVNAATHTVTNTNASGSGSFHAAIVACASGDVVDFNFSSGSAPWVINQSFQETISVTNVTIKGNTASGYSNVPLVQINGPSLGTGINVLASGCTIIGLSITGYQNCGILVQAANCTIQNCYIGINPDGTTYNGVFCAIEADGVSGLNVDGVTYGHNVLLTTDYPGVYLSDNASTGCSNATITGTIIGLNAAGTSAIGATGYGIYMDVHANGCVVGGNTTAKRNVISNIANYAVYIGGTGNTVKGNYIGTNSAGTSAFGNYFGVYSAGSGNTIGGTGSGEGNVISGNNGQGVFLDGYSGSQNETVVGNYIGLNAAGTAAIANAGGGIYIQGTYSGSSNGHVIGGTTSGAGNVVSGNTGIGIYMAQTKGTVIAGNIVGLDATGTTKIKNTTDGIYADAQSSGTTIGGATSASANIVSGNGSNGVHLVASTCTVQNNYIGLNSAGTAALGNGTAGITIDASSAGLSNQILTNVISGNTTDGITLNGSVNASETITGNIIGLNAAGTSAIANGSNGITVKSKTNIIGGSTAALRNVISGNTKYGIQITAAGTNTVKGNYIGLNAAGTSAIGNGTNGIGLNTSASNSATIGGTASGEGNVISGNTGLGIEITAGTHTIVGNIIGLDYTGASAVANGTDGISITGGSGTLIGGSTSGARNIISGHSGAHNGISVSGSAATVKIMGNYIGTDINGTTAIANGTGISTSRSITIGSDLNGSGDATEGNVISGNTTYGINISGSSSTVYGNVIGLGATGSALANGTGILITGTSNTIGNSTATTGAANTISGNTSRGIYIQNATATGNVIQGNYIGTNTGGTATLGNGLDGIILDAAKSTTIGGAATTSRNIISGNGSSGIFLTNSATSNSIANNYIGTDINGTTAIKNNSYGISLGADGNTIGPGNLLSGNNNGGINLTGNSNIIKGNLMGVNASGTSALGNNNNTDIFVSGNSNTIGGTTAADRNIISGSSPSPGIVFAGASNGNIVEGNYIGTDINGTSAIANTIGINVTSGPNTIGAAGAGNVIAGNSGNGITLSNCNSNTVIGNYMGVDATGATVLANSGANIGLTNSSSNTIGSIAAGGANILSGSSGAGITFSSGSNSNILTGNYIGLNAAGTSALPNGSNPGVLISGATGTQVTKNIISGNNSDGIKVTSGDATIQGNYIGLNAAGTSAVANTGSGINMATGSSASSIGGTSSGQGNVISGNSSRGILLSTAGHTIAGNIIGLDPTGTSAIANGSYGIQDASGGNTIGGSTTASRNIISGNSNHGIEISSGASGTDLIQNNYIGTNISGTASIQNAGHGIDMNSANHSVLNNLVSGNKFSGIVLQNGSNNVTVKGNYCGTNAAGTAAVGNVNYGIVVGTSVSGAAIGGTASGEGNLMSGNGTAGFFATGASGATLLGNMAGTNLSGTSAIANPIGISINSSTGIVIGGSASGSANLISGNTGDGISSNSTITIKGNYIGVNLSGTSALANGANGITLSGGNGSAIGGGTSGEGNLISGNGVDGIQITGGSNFTIAGNIVGMNAAGSSAVANGLYGILISSGSNMTVGGASTSLRNYISGNAWDGVKTSGSNTLIQNNYIGVDITGSSAVGNLGDGIGLASSGNTAQGNVSSANTFIGIHMSGANTIKGNYVGTNAAGTAALGNGNSGIWDDGGGNTIGGSSASDGNLVSGNSNYGIVINTVAASGSTVQNNLIGTDAAGTGSLPNGSHGVQLLRNGNTFSSNTVAHNGGAGVFVNASNNSITSNTISNNTGKGVVVVSGTGNTISNNSISGNSFGIDLGNNGVTANDAGDGDAGANNLQNFPVFTSVSHSSGNTTIKGTLNSAASTTYSIQIYSNTAADASGYGQGETNVANTSLTTDASGNGSFNITVAGTFSKLSAIAIDPSGNTSEFCQTTAPSIVVKSGTTTIANNTSTPLFNDSTSVGTPVAHTYTIYNTGFEDLVVTSLSLPSGFTSTSGLPATIAVGSNAGFDVTLSALASGTYSGNVQFGTNDAANPTFKFAVQGWVGCWNAQYVDKTGGSDANTGSASNNAKQTVQAAVDALCDGGTVYLKPGDTYNESVNSNGKNINVAFTTSSSSATTVTNFTVNGTGKTVTLDAPLTITGTLTMTNGILKTTSAAPLILSGNSATATGGSTSSYIDGPVQFSITGTQTRTTFLPIGKSGSYRPISLYTDITDGASAGNTFQAEMFNTDPHTLGLTIPALTNLTYVRYFQVDHTVSNGTVNAAQITLPFENDGTNDSISDLSNVKVMKGNGSGAWVNLKGSATGSSSGSFYNGTITSNSFTTFSPFALATGCGSNPQPSVDFSYSNSCVGTSVSFTNNTTISGGNVIQYIWDFGDGSSQLIQSGTYPPNPSGVTHTYSTSGTFTVNLEATSNLGCQVVLTKYITIAPKPQVSINNAPSEICFGTNPTITVDVSNVPTSDNWTVTYTTTNPATSSNFSGTGSGAFTFTTASLTGASSVVTLTGITNTTEGCSNSNTSAKTITVDPATSAGTLSGTATVCPGSNSGTITASGGTGSIIRWEYSTDGGTTWSQITNTSTSQSYSNLSTTTQYRAVYQSGVCASANTSPVTITVNPLPTATIGGSTTICSGNTANLTVTVGNTGGASWSVSYLEGSASKTLTGTGNGSFTLTTSALTSTTLYALQSITMTSGSPACSNAALTGVTTATVTVNQLPSATIGSGSTICNGSTATISVTISNVSSTDNWKLNYTEGATAKNITGTGPGSFSITTSALAANTTVTLTSIQNTTSTCSQTVSGSATITVNATSVGGTTSGTATVCNGNNSGSVTLSGNTGSVTKWQYSTDGGTNWFDLSNTSTTQNYTNITLTTMYRAVVQSGVCAAANSAATTITVNNLPTATISSGATICSGTTASLALTVSNTGGASWTITYQEGTSNKTISGTGNGVFTLTTGTLTGNTDVTLQSITETSGSPTCSNSLSGKASVVVNALPSASIGSGSTICNGSTATVSFTVSNVSSTDGWKLNYTEGATAKSTTGTGPGTFSVTTSALAGNTNVTLTSIQNTTSTCSQAVSGTATITVNATSVGGTTSGTATVCNGNNSGSVTLSGNTGSVTKWQYSTDGGTNWFDISNTSTTQNYTNLITTTMYRAVVQSGVCAAANSAATTITVNSLPTATISSGATICSGTTANLALTVGNTGGASWTITYQEGNSNKTISGTGNGVFTLTTGTLTGNTDVTLQSITETSGSPTCSNTLSGKASVVVNALPSASIGSGSTICNGSTATVSFTVSNVSSTDGWKLNYTEGATAKSTTGTGPGTFSVTTSALAGNTNVTLTSIQNTTTTCSQTVSGTATITVNATSVGGTTSGTATVCYGNNSGSVTLSGNTGSVTKWQYSTDGGSNWFDISNTSTTQNYTNLITATMYRAVVQSGVCAAANSAASTISVNALPTATINSGTTICSGTTAALTVTVGNTGGASWSISYQEGTATKTLTGTGNGTFTLTTGTLTGNTDVTLQSITETSGSPACSNTLSGKATVVVNALPQVTLTLGSSNVCKGTGVNMSLGISSVPSGQSWSLTFTTTNPSSTNTMTGTGSGTFTLTSPSLTGPSSTIAVTAFSNTSTSCSAASLPSGSVTVDPTSVAGTLTGAATVCYGNNSGTLSLGSGTGNVIRWEYSTDGGTSWNTINNTTSSQGYSNLTTTTQFRAVVQSGTCSSANSNTQTITINALPTASISGSTTVCSGSTAGLTVTTANTNGASWTLSYLEGTTSKTLSGTGNGSFTLTTSALTSNTDVTLTGISLTSGSPQCVNNNLTGTVTATVKVNPIPTASISGSQTICTGNAPVFYVTIGNVPTGNAWTLSYTEGATSKTLTGTGSGTFAMNTSTLTNAGSSNTTVTYTLTNIVNTTNTPNCNSSSFTGTYVVTINPATVAGTLSGTTTYCGTTNSGTLLLSGNVGSVVRWESSSDGGATWNSIANTSATQSYNNLPVSTLYHVLVQSGVCGAAYTSNAVITVNPQPAASISGTQTICTGSTPAITVTVSNVPSGNSWSLSYNEGATAKTLTGTGSGSFVLNASALTNSGSTQSNVVYTLKTVTNTTVSCSSPSLTSTYTVYIDPQVAGGSLSTGASAVCNGTNSGTIILGSQTGSIVRWERSTDGGATWTYIANTTTSQSFSNLTTTTIYRVLVQSGTCGQAYSSSQTITVNPLPVAAISGNNSVCTGSSSVVTFTVSNVAAGDNWTINYTVNSVAQTFTGKGPGNFTYTTPAMTYPPNNVVYSLVSIVNGTTGCSNSANGTATIQVNPRPVVNFSSTDVCFGLAMNFTNKSSIPAGNISSYRWDFGDGNSSSDINPDHTYAAAGTYNVKLAVYTEYGCKDSVTKAVTVYPKPSATFTYGNTCESDSAVFGSTSTISSGTIKTTSWDFGDGTTSALTAPKHKYQYTGTFLVNMVVVSDKGCTNSASKDVTVYPQPSANFSTNTVCDYDSTQFTNSSSTPLGSLTYHWTFEAGKTSTAREPKYRFSGPGTYNVKLVVTTNFGCKDSMTKTVVVDPKPTAAFSNKNVCYGGTSIFSDKSAGRITDERWNFGDSTDLTGSVVQHDYKYSGTYNVRLVVRTDKGCVDTLTKAHMVYKLPAALITSSTPLSFCFGGSVTLTTPAGTGYKYAWSDGSVTNTITVSKSGEVKVLVTDTAGCQKSDSVKVTVYPLPTADAGKDTTVSKGFPAKLHGNGGVNYSWTPSGSLDNDTLQNPTATPLTTTSYVLTVTDVHGCKSSDTVVVNVTLDFRLDTYNTITPNGDGANDAFVIDNIGTYPGSTVTIYNRYGQVLYQSTDYKNDWKGTYNGTDLPQGTYYYTVTFKDSDKVYKGSINILRNE